MVTVAQLVEHRVVIPDVAGSIPVGHTGCQRRDLKHDKGCTRHCPGSRDNDGTVIPAPAKHNKRGEDGQAQTTTTAIRSHLHQPRNHRHLHLWSHI